MGHSNSLKLQISKFVDFFSMLKVIANIKSFFSINLTMLIVPSILQNLLLKLLFLKQKILIRLKPALSFCTAKRVLYRSETRINSSVLKIGSLIKSSFLFSFSLLFLELASDFLSKESKNKNEFIYLFYFLRQSKLNSSLEFCY